MNYDLHLCLQTVRLGRADDVRTLWAVERVALGRGVTTLGLEDSHDVLQQVHFAVLLPFTLLLLHRLILILCCQVLLLCGLNQLLLPDHAPDHHGALLSLLLPHLPRELLTALGEGRGWLGGLGGGQHLAGKSCQLHIVNNVNSVKVPTDPLRGLVPHHVTGKGVLLLVHAVVQGQLLHLQGRR